MIAPQIVAKPFYSHYRKRYLAMDTEPKRKRRKLYPCISDDLLNVGGFEEKDSKCQCIDEDEEYMQKWYKRGRRSAYNTRISFFSKAQSNEFVDYVGEVLEMSGKSILYRLPDLASENLDPSQSLSKFRSLLERVHDKVSNLKRKLQIKVYLQYL